MPESAKVNIVVDALTQAAKQSIDTVGDELNNLAVDAQPAQAAMDEAADEMDDAMTSAYAAGQAFEEASGAAAYLGATLEALSVAADSAGDEIMSAGAKSTLASGGMTTLSASTDGLSIAFTSLSGTITAVLIPALLALSSALVPLAATVGGLATAAGALAGAFGAVIGSGILAYGKKLSKQNKKRLKQINSQIEKLRELRRSRANLSSEQRKALEQARETVETLTAKRKQTGELTAAQKKRLAQAQETIRAMQRHMKTVGALTDKERKRLKQLKKKKGRLKEQTSVMGALGGAMSKLKDELMPMIVAFGKQFIPLIEDAVAAIPTLAKRIGAAVGGFDAFAQALRQMGQAAMTAIPAAASALMSLAKDALPVLMDFVAWLMENGDEIFAGMVSTTKKVAPMLLNLGQAFVDAIPAINRLGTTILTVIIPALADLTKMVARVMGGANFRKLADQLRLSDDAMKALTQGVKSLIRGFVAILPVLKELVTGILNRAVPAFGAFLNIIGKVAQAFGSLPLWAQQAALVAILAAVAALGGPLTALAAAIGIVAIAWDEMAGAIDWVIQKGSAFVKWAKTGLISTMRKAGNALSTAWTDAKQSAVQFFRALPRMAITGLATLMTMFEGWGADLYNFFVGLWNSILQVTTKALQGMINKTITAINDFLKTLEGVADAVSQIPGVGDVNVGRLKSVDLSSQQMQAQKRAFNRQKAQKQNKQEIKVALEVAGDNPLARFIQDQVDTKVSRKEQRKTRRMKRMNNRGPSA